MRDYIVGCLLLFSSPCFAQQELLHWWSTKGELRALQSIEKLVKREGGHSNDLQWQVNSIRGEGGLTAAKVLQTRGLAGKLPTLAQLSGTEITTWAKFGLLESLNDTAAQVEWEKVMRPLTLPISQYQGAFIALPLAIHRVNWLWTNDQLFELHKQTVPQNVDQFIATIKAFKAHNIKPLAIGNQPWQIAILFENVALGLTDKQYYQKAFMALDEEAINAPEMQLILNKFREISLLIKTTIKSESWEKSTLGLLNNEVAMQISGDWVLGEIMALDADALATISCHSAPGTGGHFIYNMDHIVHFKNENNARENQSAQRLLRKLSSKRLQHDFNKFKGSLPARSDVDLSGFNRCALASEKAYQKGVKTQALLPSMTDSMAINPIMQKMIISQIYTFFNDPQMTNQTFIQNILDIAAVKNMP